MVGEDRTADSAGEIIGVERVVFGGGAHEFRLGVHILVIEIVTGQAMELV